MKQTKTRMCTLDEAGLAFLLAAFLACAGLAMAAGPDASLLTITTNKPGHYGNASSTSLASGDSFDTRLGEPTLPGDLRAPARSSRPACCLDLTRRPSCEAARGLGFEVFDATASGRAVSSGTYSVVLSTDCETRHARFVRLAN